MKKFWENYQKRQFLRHLSYQLFVENYYNFFLVMATLLTTLPHRNDFCHSF